MKLSYATRDLERTCTDARRMQKSLGAERAKKLQLRLDDLRAAEKMADDDEEVDNLRTHQFRLLLDEGWDHGVEAAVDCALLGRYYERIADHAVLMGSRVIYIVTGMQPEGENWTIA